MKVSNIPSVVKQNIEIAQKYIALYPQLKRYLELQKIQDDYRKRNENFPQILFEESTNLWSALINLKVHNVANFMYHINDDTVDFLLNTKKADVKSLIKKIKRSIKEELDTNQYNPMYQYYSHRDHMDLVEVRNAWDKINTQSDFIKVLQDVSDYRTFEFCPFNPYNEEIINVIINNNIEKFDDLGIDVDSNMLEVFNIPDTTTAMLEVSQFESDQETIKKIIDELLPICERAKATDSCWENNFFHNKILHEIKRRMS